MVFKLIIRIEIELQGTTRLFPHFFVKQHKQAEIFYHFQFRFKVFKKLYNKYIFISSVLTFSRNLTQTKKIT